MRELKNTKIIAVDAVEYSLKQALPLFLSGLTAGMVQREPQIRQCHLVKTLSRQPLAEQGI